MEVIHAIKTRRSHRQYTDEVVTADELNAVMDAARWAPSWANSQSWHFVVVLDKGVKSRIADSLTGNRASQAVQQAPVLIVCCAEPGKSGCFDGAPVTDKGLSWYMYDAALAMQNLSLAAHELGLGTVHLGRFDAAAVGSIVNLPDNLVVVAMTPLGHPPADASPPAPPRKRLEEIITYDAFERPGI
ncbi:MAG: nitroreductase family protein [Dehalogenimonas sp.]|uniref:Nitroreductase family protein n=1 Tax=Candidatus Dehalogenimonas loeffleri TaxID=3127115 RepID=A0ABZ2J5L3_9CHLR|nr:nitroreductase family protein [Dehalogenimonas sp.]